MGAIKDALQNHTRNTPQIESFLQRDGFEYTSYVQGPIMGYQRGFYSQDRAYFTYVHCDLENRIVRMYKEYECGGHIADTEIEIPDIAIVDDDPEYFADWLDEETASFIG